VMNTLSVFRNWKDVVEFESGAVIFTEGDPADVLFVILSGEVELTLRGASLGVEGKGNIIGEMAMLEAAPRRSTAVARSPVRLAKLERDQFQKLIGENAEFALGSMTALANRLRAVDRFIVKRALPKGSEV
jgi:CRP/FNR family cyclic AMP-dependent transcriptional regulator